MGAADCQLFSHVQSHFNYYIYIIYSPNKVQNTFSQSGNDSKWFLKKSFFKIGMWHLRPPRDPPPFMANAILNFHFDYWHTSLNFIQCYFPNHSVSSQKVVHYCFDLWTISIWTVLARIS